MPTHASDEVFLRWLRDIIVNSVRQGVDDLTMRQLAVLMIIYGDKTPRTVRGLAKALLISRPAISRALDHLGGKGFTQREIDQCDRRSILVRRTRKGAERMQQLRGLMSPSPTAAGTPETAIGYSAAGHADIPMRPGGGSTDERQTGQDAAADGLLMGSSDAV